MSIPHLNTIQVTIGKTVHEFTRGLSLQQILGTLPPNPVPTMAARVNGELQELTYPLFADSTVEWLDLTGETGLRIYKRSVNLILLMAVNELFPDYHLKIEHSLVKGTYCELRGESPLGETEIARLEQKMHLIVEEDLPISRREVAKDDAVKYFTGMGREDKAQLMSFRPSETINLYTCGPVTDYFFGNLTPSTGFLPYFQLRPFDKGFLVLVPDKNNPTGIAPYREPRKFAAVFAEAERRGELLGVENISQLNELNKNGRQDEVIQVAETLHERNLFTIAEAISADRNIKLVLIAGPSSSGKTTFAQRLSIQFRANGIKPVAISLDNYFVDRDKTPLDENGELDFEDINALDLELFNQNLRDLIAGEDVILPLYDFKTGMRMNKGYPVKMAANQILIVEGIHGLNEKLTAAIPKENKRKIYVSALTQLNIDDYNPIPSSDTRLIRRMARDLQFRGISPKETLKRWHLVRRGEEKNIFPFQEDADFIFNSALVYELAVLKEMVEEELKKIPASAPEHTDAKRLVDFLQYFLPMNKERVPIHSILREFLGGSCF